MPSKSLKMYNPRRDGSMTRGERKIRERAIRRSWEDPYFATVATDDLGIETMLYGKRRNKRRNPLKDPRYATTRIIRRRPPGEERESRRPTSERTTRVIRRSELASASNPRNRLPTASDVEKARRWWKRLSKARKQDVVSRFLGTRSNPPHAAEVKRAIVKAMRAMSRAEHVSGRRRKRHVRDFDRYMGRARNPAVGGGKKQHAPGALTRGEKRRVKYLEYLRTLADKGAKARTAMEQMVGEIKNLEKKIYKGAMGVRAEKRVMKLTPTEYAEAKGISPAEAKEEIAELKAEASVAVAAPEPAEVRAIKQRLADTDAIIADFRAQISEIDADDDLNGPEIDMLHKEIEKMAGSKKRLRDQLSKLEVATNPRRRNPLLTNPRRRLRTVKVKAGALARLNKAIKALAITVRSMRKNCRR